MVSHTRTPHALCNSNTNGTATPVGLRSRELTMPVPHHMGCSLPTFQDAHNGNVLFVIGTLDGYPVKLNLLKDYVSKALFTLVNNLAFSSFNIIHFTCEITKWCDRAVICNPETACEAASWVRNLPCEPGISPVLALSAAFEDTGCQTVYLAIDSLPGSVLQDIYALLARHKDACSVQVVYLVGEPCDSPTQGQFKTVSLHPSGSAKEVTVKGNFIGNNCCNASRFGPLLSPNYSEVRVPLISCTKYAHEPAAKCTGKEDTFSPEGLCLLRGVRVLARRETDGLYYLGHIAHEVEGSNEHFLVEFEKCRSLKGIAQFRMQETPVCDIIHYEDARWKPLVPGDHVLAPLEANMEQYGPATVLDGSESRSCALAVDSDGVLVTFWNGKTKRVPPGMAVWIPQQLSEHITLALHIPQETRKKLAESCYKYPYIMMPQDCSVRTCPSQQGREPHLGFSSQSCLYCAPRQGPCFRCQLYEEHLAAMRKSMSLKSTKTLTKEKANKKVEKNKEQKNKVGTDVNHCRAIRNDKSFWEPREKVKMEDASIKLPQEKRLVCNRDTQTNRIVSKYSQTDKLVSSTVEDSSMSETTKSSYKPSNRLGNMTYLQTTLQRIEKAMKEDRLALEAAIRERRPRTAPLLKNYELKANKSQELRERKQTSQDDLLRMQAEQRCRRMEEKIKEVEMREQMLQDSRRLRSEQRILLDLERKQDKEGLKAQQAESHRAAALERTKKQEEAIEMEQRRETQQVQFLTDRRKQRELMELEEGRKMLDQEQTRKELMQRRTEAEQRKQENHLSDWHRHLDLQETRRRRSSQRLEEFYRKVEQDSQKDKDLQQYLKERNLQALRSAMVL